MVTLRGIVHCSEPGTHPCPSLSQALHRGACPRAPAMYTRAARGAQARLLGSGPGMRGPAPAAQPSPRPSGWERPPERGCTR